MNDDSINFEKCPELKVVYDMQLKIDSLNDEIESTDDKAQRLEKLGLMRGLAKLQTQRLLDYITELTVKSNAALSRSYEVIEKIEQANVQLAEKLQAERREQNEFYNNFCACMTTNPRGMFEDILKEVEKNAKIEDSDGRAWQWTLKFHFLARLRMAWKLVFGSSGKIEDF